MGILDHLFGKKPQSKDSPKCTAEAIKPLAEVCDAYAVLMGDADRSNQRVCDLKSRLGRLMDKHEIRWIARGKTLIKRSWWWGRPYLELQPLNRFGPDVYKEDARGAHLLPLVDALLVADGDYERNWGGRKALSESLVQSAAHEFGGEEGEFVYHGYHFQWHLYKYTSPTLYVTRILDLDG